MSKKDSNLIYRIRKITIDKGNPLYSYCETVTSLANNLHNVVRFRQRQVLTAVMKDSSEWTENESAIMDEITNAIPEMGSSYKIPTAKKSFLSYSFLDKLLKITKNPDYYAEGMPRQSAQQTIKACVSDMENFYKAVSSYKVNPGSFTGKPVLPGYSRKGARHTATLTNQDCVIRYSDENSLVKLPLTKLKLDIGYIESKAVLKEIKIIPNNNTFIMSVCLQYEHEQKLISDVPSRIVSIDFGVDNLMAVTNNCELPCILYKGGCLKSVNRLYNKKIAAIVSKQTINTTNKFIPTDEYYRITNYRNDYMNDVLHKTAKHFVLWCVENRIDTIVLGDNKLWKQDVHIGSVNNQNFVQIPHSLLKSMIKYLAEYHGIRIVHQEESYTSKASFLDFDDIPTYDPSEEKHYSFSGRRRPSSYKGIYKKDGFRGLYQSKDGTIINSDLNGSANILRKAFPSAFDDLINNSKNPVDFSNVIIIKHVDYEKAKLNKEVQLKKNISSKLKEKRKRRKLQNEV